MKRFFGKITFDVLILNGRLTAIHHVDFLGHDVHGGDLVVLCQKGGDTQADIAGTGNGDTVGFHDSVCIERECFTSVGWAKNEESKSPEENLLFC